MVLCTCILPLLFRTVIDPSLVRICVSCVNCLNIVLSYNHYVQRWIAASSGIQDVHFVPFGIKYRGYWQYTAKRMYIIQMSIPELLPSNWQPFIIYLEDRSRNKKRKLIEKHCA
ncbi:unnamed protein product [Schistosoma rodhaini]|nr:unnamed protein product [Schistosoma rodhaini]